MVVSHGCVHVSRLRDASYPSSLQLSGQYTFIAAEAEGVLNLVLKSLDGIVSSSGCNSERSSAFQKPNTDLKKLCVAVRERSNDLKSLRASSVSNTYP